MICVTDKFNGGEAILDFYKGIIVLYKSTDGITATMETANYIKGIGTSYDDTFEFNGNGFKIHFADSENFGQMLFKSEMLRIYYHNREKRTIRQYEYENFVYLYEAYKALKGNSFIDKIYKEVQQ